MNHSQGILVSLLALLLVSASGCTPAPATSPLPTDAPEATGAPTPTATPTPHTEPSPTYLAAPSPISTNIPAPSRTPSPTAAPAPTATEQPIPLPNAPDLDILDLYRRIGRTSGDPRPPAATANPIEYEVGRLDEFWVVDLVDEDVYRTQAELTHVSEHAYWYFERGLESSQEAIGRTARIFEDTVYPAVASRFGSRWRPGVGSAPRITILNARLRGAAGYFNSSDHYPAEVYPHSNEREMVYMDLGSLPLGSSAYLGALAHELQHAAHWAGDPGEESWVNEGLSEVAKGRAGYDFSFVGFFLSSPATTLTTWPSHGASSLPHYGASGLFFEYLAQRYGGHDKLGGLVDQPEDGVEGVNAYLESLGFQSTFQDVFRDWLAANYLDPLGVDPYYYDGLDISVRPGRTITESGSISISSPQYAGEYMEVRLPDGDARLTFQGQAETRLIPTDPYSGAHCWWGNRGDSIDSTLTAALDLTQVDKATLRFRAWYNIEAQWDYAYVEASQDGGETWAILEGGHSSPENPLGLSFGPGYTGSSGGWIQESIDLTPYAGSNVLLRFEYVTDSAINEDGICIDDIAVPEIGFFEDAETDGVWTAEGFVRTDNHVPQGYVVQVVLLGDETSVVEMPVDGNGNGSLTLRGFGGELGKAVVIIAPTAPRTTQPASYVLTVERAGEG